MSNLSQINLQFRAVDDRLLLLLKTNELAEFRFWLTRRFVKSLWPALVSCLASDEIVAGQSEAQARQTVLSFQHENAVAKSNFAKTYDQQVCSTPLGPEPLLVARAKVKRNDSRQPVLGLYPAQGQGIELALDDVMLHSLCKLLSQSVGKADWDMRLNLGATNVTTPPSAREVN